MTEDDLIKPLVQYRGSSRVVSFSITSLTLLPLTIKYISYSNEPKSETR